MQRCTRIASKQTMLFETLSSSCRIFFNLDHSVIDPSLYALHIVSSNLDFDNQKFVQIMEKSGRHFWTREEGMAELRKNFRQD